jgi:hypothetical protein
MRPFENLVNQRDKFILKSYILSDESTNILPDFKTLKQRNMLTAPDKATLVVVFEESDRRTSAAILAC